MQEGDREGKKANIGHVREQDFTLGNETKSHWSLLEVVGQASELSQSKSKKLGVTHQILSLIG